MVDISVEWFGDQLNTALASVRPALARGAGSGLKESGGRWDHAMQRRFKGGYNRFGQPPGTIASRTKRLRSGLAFRVTESDELDKVGISLLATGVPYARAQEYGAVIKPVKARVLTLPGQANLTPAGVTRKPSAREWFREYEGKGQIAIIKTPGGASTVVLFRKTKRSKWEHWWTFVKKATIKGPKTTGDKSRLGFRDTWDEQRETRTEVMRKHVQKAVDDMAKGVNGGS